MKIGKVSICEIIIGSWLVISFIVAAFALRGTVRAAACYNVERAVIKREVAQLEKEHKDMHEHGVEHKHVYEVLEEK